MKHLTNILAGSLAALAFSPLSLAADFEATVVIKDHRFVPAEVQVPAGRKFRLVVDNQDSTPEEFESHALGREKVIAGGTKATIRIGPLKPGRYPFVGEFHESSARGALIAR